MADYELERDTLSASLPGQGRVPYKKQLIAVGNGLAPFRMQLVDNLVVDRVIVLVGYPFLTPVIRCSSSYFALYGWL
jgi:hypothetical protein